MSEWAMKTDRTWKHEDKSIACCILERQLDRLLRERRYVRMSGFTWHEYREFNELNDEWYFGVVCEAEQEPIAASTQGAERLLDTHREQ